MSSLGGNSGGRNMGAPFFHEFKKQASFFFKEKIKTARLALTDVTPAQLLTEEVTGGNPWSADTRTMGLISRAAFEVDDYGRIVEILHNRLLRFDRKNWRAFYNSLILLEHLLTHGPESVAGEFQSEKGVIEEMGSFQYIDEKGFNWGLTVRKKSERVLKLLQKGPLLKEERNRARKLTRGIKGFGSFTQKSSSAQGILRESSFHGRCTSHLSDDENQLTSDEGSTRRGVGKSQQTQEDNAILAVGEKAENSNTWGSFSNGDILKKCENQTSFKENMVLVVRDLHEWSCTGESKPLLDGNRNEPRTAVSVDEDHPFNHAENQTTASLLSTRNEILQGC
ncbi:hypothetical protein VitviT2T_008138 [Vitis vinifera]|uniref:ENTH domain-containing protein n=2 Tax=Vitis vinifera TaxID=29760 RepID=A0ABY9C0X7_VITVI|nr:epsin-3 isoform X3 [Vitis vinifera]XP_059593444.1 epsin-3 isoform X3 [Vitis vinifera]WJZ88875.1 hypothetical protein VitviT2T_008138 [Vitis vinifera]|eukprot:XP_002283929.2 PREDICTED: epsin-3 [Vitis vinifera]